MKQNDASIVLLGPKESGKSFYVLSLCYYGYSQEEEPGERRYVVLPGSVDAANLVQDTVAAIKEGRRAATHKVSGHSFNLYSLPPRPSRRWPRSEPARLESRLTCWDVPGGMQERGLNPDEEGFKDLAHADGMILLLPPLGVREARDSRTFWHDFFAATLNSLLDYYSKAPLEEQRRVGWRADQRTIPFPVALCVSQADELPVERQQQLYGASGARELVLALLGDRADKLVDTFQTKEYFAFTAMGGSLETTGGVQRLIRDPEPRFVLDPVKWILAQIRRNTDVRRLAV